MKYFNKKVKAFGLTFDSVAERDRYILLRERERCGEITSLRTQVEFELVPKQTRQVTVHLKTKDKVLERVDERAVRYHCDFMYYDVVNGYHVIEEVKSKMTERVRDYPLRRKLIKLKVRQMNAEAGEEKYVFNEIIVK